MAGRGVPPLSVELEEGEDREKAPAVAQLGTQEHRTKSTNDSTERSLDSVVPGQTIGSNNSSNHTQEASSFGYSAGQSESDGPIDKWRPEFAGIRGQLSKASRSNIVSTSRKKETADSQIKTGQREGLQGSNTTQYEAVPESIERKDKKKRKRKKRKRKKDFHKNATTSTDMASQLSSILLRLDQLAKNQEEIFIRLSALESTKESGQDAKDLGAALEKKTASDKANHREIVHEVTKIIFSRR